MGGASPRQIGPAVDPDGALSFVTIGGPGSECLSGAPRTAVEIDTVTPPRDLVMIGVSLEGAEGATTGGAWVARVDPETGPQAGSFQEGVPGINMKNLGWPARQPLHGAVLQEGRTYRVFVRVTIVKDGRLAGIRFTYTDSGTPGSSVREGTVRAATRC